VSALGALLMLTACAPPALGQQAVTYAAIGGRVEDANGAALPGVSVTATNAETNQSRTSKTDEEGRYRFSYLAVGTYQLRVEKAGFASLTRRLTLTIGQALDVPLALPVAGVAESVQVTDADAPVVETARTQLAETVVPKEIDSLPLNGRNYLDLAALTPGVTRTNPVANQRFPETSAVPGTGLSITGQRFINNGFVVDGLSSNDDAADLAGTFYSQEVIREFEVITSGGIAEFGRASGGVVNIVTRSGTNDYRGRVYGFLRDQRLDARNTLAPAKDPFTQAQCGASFGGPIRHDRAFFFSNFEQTRLNNATVITISPAGVVAVNARLEQVGYKAPRISTGVVPTGFDTTNFMFRLDQRLNGKNQLTARYNLYDIESLNARNVGGLNALSRGTALSNRDQTLAVSVVSTLSTRTVNEARSQLTRSRLTASVNDRVGPAVNVSGVASFGRPTRRRSRPSAVRPPPTVRARYSSACGSTSETSSAPEEERHLPDSPTLKPCTGLNEGDGVRVVNSEDDARVEVGADDDEHGRRQQQHGVVRGKPEGAHAALKHQRAQGVHLIAQRVDAREKAQPVWHQANRVDGVARKEERHRQQLADAHEAFARLHQARDDE
jgi:hypothetical protein